MIILSHCFMTSGKGHSCWVFHFWECQCNRERGRTLYDWYLQDLATRSKQSRWINSTIGESKNMNWGGLSLYSSSTCGHHSSAVHDGFQCLGTVHNALGQLCMIWQISLYMRAALQNGKLIQSALLQVGHNLSLKLAADVCMPGWLAYCIAPVVALLAAANPTGPVGRRIADIFPLFCWFGYV